MGYLAKEDINIMALNLVRIIKYIQKIKTYILNIFISNSCK